VQRSVTYLGTLALVLGSAAPLRAQTAEDCDSDRAMLSDAQMFDAFYPAEYESLADHLDDWRVDDDSALLVLEQAKYYPLSAVQSQDDALLDGFAGDQVLIDYHLTARALVAKVTEAYSYEWNDRILRLANGDRIEDGVLYDGAGDRKARHRQLHVFTSWCGFSFTFPESLVYERPVS